MRQHFAFYPADWSSDVALRQCSYAARGLWIDILAMLHRSPERGKLILPSGADEAAFIALELREPVATIAPLLAELDARRVFSRDSAGRLYSRRMVRDSRLTEIRQRAGALGGRNKQKKVLLKQNAEVQTVKEHPTFAIAKQESGNEVSEVLLWQKSEVMTQKEDTTFAIAKQSEEVLLKQNAEHASSKEDATFAIAKNLSSEHNDISMSAFKLESEDKAHKDKTKIQDNTGKKFVVPDDLIGLELYAADARLCKRWPELLPAWRQSFPAVDIMAEVRRAHGWEVANPVRRKKDRARFLNTWLGRVQDRGGSVMQRNNGTGYSTSAARLEAASDKMQSILGGGENVNGSNIDAREDPF